MKSTLNLDFKVQLCILNIASVTMLCGYCYCYFLLEHRLAHIKLFKKNLYLIFSIINPLLPPFFTCEQDPNKLELFRLWQQLILNKGGHQPFPAENHGSDVEVLI